MEGIIIKNISNDYVVNVNNNNISCKARGKFRNIGTIPLVGDRVIVDVDNHYILDILERKNSLIRPSVSNVDQAIIVVSVKNPELDTYLLDKLLTIIEFNNIEPVICFTKLDLLEKEELDDLGKFMNYYRKIGYKVVDNTNRNNFINLFKNKISVLTGQSGAGKSTLLNMLDSNLNLKTDEISFALNRGKHTTRHTELYSVMGGYIVDTPGFSSVDFHGMDDRDIRDNMRDIFEYTHLCKYRDCMHIKEDGCGVIAAYNSGKILASRYFNYKQFIELINKTRK